MRMCWAELDSALHFIAVPLSELQQLVFSAHPSSLSKCSTVTGLQIAWHTLALRYWTSLLCLLPRWVAAYLLGPAHRTLYPPGSQWRDLWLRSRLRHEQQCWLLMWHHFSTTTKMKSKITHFYSDLTLLPFLSLTHTHMSLKSDTSRLWMCTHHTSHQPSPLTFHHEVTHISPPGHVWYTWIWTFRAGMNLSSQSHVHWDLIFTHTHA